MLDITNNQKANHQRGLSCSCVYVVTHTQAQCTYLLEKLLCLGASIYRENSEGLRTWDPMHRDSVSLQTFSFFCAKHLSRKITWFLIHSHSDANSRLCSSPRCSFLEVFTGTCQYRAILASLTPWPIVLWLKKRWCIFFNSLVRMCSSTPPNYSFISQNTISFQRKYGTDII